MILSAERSWDVFPVLFLFFAFLVELDEVEILKKSEENDEDEGFHDRQLSFNDCCGLYVCGLANFSKPMCPNSVDTFQTLEI